MSADCTYIHRQLFSFWFLIGGSRIRGIHWSNIQTVCRIGWMGLKSPTLDPNFTLLVHYWKRMANMIRKDSVLLPFIVTLLMLSITLAGEIQQLGTFSIEGTDQVTIFLSPNLMELMLSPFPEISEYCQSIQGLKYMKIFFLAIRRCSGRGGNLTLL